MLSFFNELSLNLRLDGHFERIKHVLNFFNIIGFFHQFFAESDIFQQLLVEIEYFFLDYRCAVADFNQLIVLQFLLIYNVAYAIHVTYEGFLQTLSNGHKKWLKIRIPIFDRLVKNLT